MAARNQHVQDSTVVERRLRPIYEWLDSGNPKKALQEAEKVLKKTPMLQCAKALKALSLLQLGREPDCVAILNTLAKDAPSDNSTLQAMTICYRDLGQLDRVCQLYEKAVSTEPTNEELHTHLFMSYVRTANFKMQQQSAMALYKMKLKNPYYFWAVMSVVLQATRGQGASDSNRRALLLSLAERMVDKLVGENKLEAEQEVHLYLMVLELQNKYEQALSTLDGPLGDQLTSSPVDQHRIPYLIKLQKWSDLCLLCTELLLSNVDRWDTWNYYLTAVFSLYAARTNGTTDVKDVLEGPDDTPDRAHEFICSAIEQASTNNTNNSVSYRLRGPYLARFELCTRVQAIGEDVNALLGDPAELFVEYFRLFGHKPCCVPDLRPYLRLLDPVKRTQLASRLLKDVGIGSTTLPQSEEQMQKHICALQLSRLCGGHANLDSEYVRALVAALALHYQNGAHSFGSDRLATDQGPADPYALLAAHALYDLAIAGSCSAPLVAAVALLEAVLARSPSNFHARLLCVRLYHSLGATEGAERMYVALDTKHLQMDSLGFVHCARMQGSGHFAATATLYDATLKFFSTNYRDSIDHLTFSYKFGSFLKLEEFMDFRERLNDSLHYTLTAVDRMMLELVVCTSLKALAIIDPSPKNNNIDWDSLRDNNDYGVYLSWDPECVDYPSVEAFPTVKQLFEEDRDLARIRAGILCCISAALDIPRTTDESGREQRAKTLSDAVRDWLGTCDEVHIRRNQQHFEKEQQCLDTQQEHLDKKQQNLDKKQQNFDKKQQHCFETQQQFLDKHQKHLDKQQQLLEELKINEEQCVEMRRFGPGACMASRVSLPSPSRLRTYLQAPYKEVFGRLFRVVLRFATGCRCEEDTTSAVDVREIGDVLVEMCSQMAGTVREQNSVEDCLWSRRVATEFAVNTIEILCVSCVLCGVCAELLRPTHKKGKKRTPTESVAKVRLDELVTSFKRACTDVDKSLEEWQTPGEPGDLAERLATLAIAPADGSDHTIVMRSVRSSHVTAMKDMRAALAIKIKYLGTLC